MKKIHILSYILVAFLFTNCTKDLDTTPLNESDFTSDKAYGNNEESYLSGLAKIYFNFANTQDLDVDDGGASELVRAFWTLQEVSADACKCAWANDSWVNDINNNSWSDAENAATYAVYARTIHAITYTNEYLKQTTDGALKSRGCDEALINKVHSFRAEARFLRAYFYWMAMDIFGDVPFITEESEFGTANPKQAPRKEVFEFIEKELLDLAASSDMPAVRSNYPRADKGAVYGLLARLYLNAEVYTGTAKWNEAKSTCEELFKLGYSICSNYSWLFRGDNGENPEAKKELIFTVAYDHLKTQSYGGTSYLSFSAISADDDFNTLMGINSGWGGNRVPYEYARDYFGVKNQNYETGEYEVTDERGKLFYIKGRQESMVEILNFICGWSLFKYNNTPHNKNREEYATEAKTQAYSNVDYPLIRLGEIYLIYAEACLKTGNITPALPYLNELRTRAKVNEINTYDEQWLLEERARELIWEGHRRTDLIRYNKFNSASFLWKWKGGSYDGQGFESYKNIYAIPPSEMASNLDLYQNPGYSE